MKKVILTVCLFLGMTMGAFAQQDGGGLFGKGTTPQNDFGNRDAGNGPMLPVHGESTNQPANGDVPLGGGALLLVGFGAAYALAKKKEK